MSAGLMSPWIVPGAAARGSESPTIACALRTAPAPCHSTATTGPAAISAQSAASSAFEAPRGR